MLLLWLGGRVFLKPDSASVLEQLDLLRVFVIYALFFTGPPALLSAALGASALFALSFHGQPRRVLLLAGSVLGAVLGLIAAPPPGHHLVGLLRGVPPTNPYAVAGAINGAMWGLIVAACAARPPRPAAYRRQGTRPSEGAEGQVE